MVARKSSRVKKTTVVYQAPEQVPRSHRNTPQKTAAPRRSFNREIELYMECVDDELSPAQLKAIKEAQKEHEKANDLIKEVRAGNTLVPSSQPNTFTIVPPKPSPAPSKPLPAPKAQAPVFMSAPVPQDTGSQRGLPPPRPAQFLSKQLQEMKKSSGSRVSPEVILLSDTSTSAQSSGKMTSVNVPVAHISGSSVPVQQMNSLLASPGSGVASHQVYKFVSLPSNMPANIVSNQWQLKPVLAGVQQTQMTLVSPTSQAITNVTQVPAGRQSQEQMPAQRSTGEELSYMGRANITWEELFKEGGSKLLQRQGNHQGSTVIHNSYLSNSGRSYSRNLNYLCKDSWQHRKTEQFKKCRKKICAISKAYSWTIETPCVKLSKLPNTCKGMQFCGKSPVPMHGVYSKFKCWLRKRKFYAKGKKSKKLSKVPRQFLKNLEDQNVSKIKKNNTSQWNTLAKDVNKGSQYLKNTKKSVSEQINGDDSYVVTCACQEGPTLNNLKGENARTPFSELRVANNIKDNRTMLELHVPFSGSDDKRCCDENNRNSKSFNDIAKLTRLDKENLSIENLSGFNKMKCSTKSKKQKKKSIEKESSVRKLYETLFDVHIPRQFGIVNMVYESARYMSCDTDNLTMRTTDDCSTISDGQLSDITNIASETLRDTEIGMQGKDIYPNLNETREGNAVDVQVQRCMNRLVDQVVTKDRTEMEFMFENVELLNRHQSKTTDCYPKFDEVKTIERTSCLSSCTSLNEGSIKQSELSGDFDKPSLVINGVNNAGGIIKKQPIDSSDESCKLTDQNMARSSGNGKIPSQDVEICKGQDNFKRKWYEDMSITDELFIVLLCNQFGFTKISKDLLIPKTDLLKLRRSVRKSKHLHGKSTTYAEVPDAVKYNIIEDSFLKVGNNLNNGEDSVLRKYYPHMYTTAQNLLKERAGNKEELNKQECDENELDKNQVLESCMDKLATNVNVATNCVSAVCLDDFQLKNKEQPDFFEEIFANKLLDRTEQLGTRKVEKVAYNNNVARNVSINSDEGDSKSEPGNLIIDLNSVENETLNNTNQVNMRASTELEEMKTSDAKDTQVKELDTQSDKDSKIQSEQSSSIDKHSDRAESINCNELILSEVGDSNNLHSGSITCEENEKNVKDYSFEYINNDHCYERVLTETANTCNTDRTITKEVIQIEEDHLVKDSLHIPLNDCLTYPGGEFQVFDGRFLAVFQSIPKAKLDEIMRHVAEFGLKSTAARYKMPEEHLQILSYHSLSCGLSKTRDINQQLERGLPDNYESSNHANELPCKMFPEIISFDETSTYERHSTPSCRGQIRKDINKKLKSYLKVRSVKEINSFNSSSISDIPKEDTIMIESFRKEKFDSDGKPLKDKETLVKQTHELSGDICKVYYEEAVHTVFTRQFLENFAKNHLYFALDQPHKISKEMVLANQSAFELIDTQNHIKTFQYNGKVRHRYSPELQRQLLLLASSVGIKAVSEYFDIAYDTMKRWKENLRKALEKYTKCDLSKIHIDSTKHKPVHTKKTKRRIKLSRNLKIKICHLCHTEGIGAVCEQYNIDRRLVRRWMNEFEFEFLPNYELTSKELVELVEYGEYKCSLANIDTSTNKNSADKFCSVPSKPESRNNGEKLLSNHENKQEKVISKINSFDKESVEKGIDKQFQMTFPNNMEVILDFGDGDSDSKGESVIEDVFSPVVESDLEDNIFETDTSLETMYSSKTNGNRKETENIKDGALKKEFIDQNSSFMEAVSKELLSNNSDNEDVVEIMSWNVRNEHNLEDSGKEKTLEQRNLPEYDKADEEISVVVENDDHNFIAIGMHQDLKLTNSKAYCKVTALKENKCKSLEVKKHQVTCSLMPTDDTDMDKNLGYEACVKDKNHDRANDTIENLQNRPVRGEMEKPKVLTNSNEEPNKNTMNLDRNSHSTDMNERVNSCTEVTNEQLKDNDVDMLENNLIDHDENEIIARVDRDFPCLEEPQLQTFCHIDIKEEPYDEEFDRIEHGTNVGKQTSDTEIVDKSKKISNRDRVNRSRLDFKCHHPANSDTSDEGIKGTDFMDKDISKLGTGDGDSSKSQGYTFQTASGSKSSGSEGARQTIAPGNVPDIDLNLNSLSAENVQIVGTQDLIPGQEYILVDPRMFNSVSNAFQNLTPPTLIRPHLSQVNTVYSARPRIQVSALVSSIPKAGDKPTPVHMVENKSLKVGTSVGSLAGSVSPLQNNIPKPSLTLFGKPNLTTVSPNLKQGSHTVRSLLTGMQVPKTSGVTHVNYAIDQKRKIDERKQSNFDVSSDVTDLQKPSTTINPASKSNVALTQGGSKIARSISTTQQSNINEERQTASLKAEKADKTLYTLKGIGSVSNKDLEQSRGMKQGSVCTSLEVITVSELKGNDTQRPHEQFSKYLSNTDMLVEKERKILQALLLQKSKKKESPAKFDNSTTVESKHANTTSHEQGCSRIDSLIQKMTNRVKKGPDKMKLDLSSIDTDNSSKSEGSHSSIPASASEILFGEHASHDKKETEKGLLFKTQSVKSSLFDAKPVNLTGSPKKELRKSPLVMREIESTEDESSTSSSTSESTSSAETDSNIEECEHAEGRIEHVDLSAKLKSLLSADIFNVIESEKGNNTEEDDVIDMLAKSTDSSQNLNEELRNKLTGPANTCHDAKSEKTELETSVPLKRGGINYSLNVKKKLGKLASMFSTASLHKKYGVNPQTLSKWKAKFQDEEIAGLELTEAELKELEDVNNIKKAMYRSNAQEYDIYVDNPEEEEVVNDSKKKKNENESIRKHTLEKKHMFKTDVKYGQGNKFEAKGYFEKSNSSSTLSRTSIGMSEKAEQKKVKAGTPLYITIDEDASDEMKQQLRRNLKTQKTAEHVWSNGAFSESSKTTLSSVFGTDKSGEDEKVELSVANRPLISVHSSGTPGSSETRDEDKKRKTFSNVLDEKMSVPSNEIWEKTVYLCPDEGIFKYRYEKKSAQEFPITSHENQTYSILDDLFRSPVGCDTSTYVQETVDDKSKPQVNSMSSSPTVSNLHEEDTKQSLNTSPNKPVLENVYHDNEVYSANFKWTVVKEARKSGFEKTAKWFGISMTDIMKWHDTFLHEKKCKQLDTADEVLKTTESESAVVDLSNDENIHSNRTEPNLIQTPVKPRLGALNANLSFERIQVKEGAITKPRFNSRSDNDNAAPQICTSSVSPSNRTQRTRMGPNTIKYATPKVDPDQLQKFQADVQGDLGIMPKLMKKSNSRDGVEIASTWKQVQSVLRPEKPVERRYTQEFKQKIIAECERKGQKTVAHENRIPYNEISRWRLEAKKSSMLPTPQKSTFAKTDLSKRVESSLSAATASINTSSKKTYVESSANHSGKYENRSGTEQESLKIKIKLSTLPQSTPTVSKKKTSGHLSGQEHKIKDVHISNSHQKFLDKHGGETFNLVKPFIKAGEKNIDRSEKEHPSNEQKNTDVERTESLKIDEDADLRMEVINFCFDHGVLKTQKKYNVTRQSIIDLMKEYDELSKLEVDNYNKLHGLHSFKTKLVSREKTSVEVTNTATKPIIVKNLNDYIVTQEYMKTVVDYALKHGITAASRKYKRKTSTVRSWMNQFQREVKKKISVEQVAKEQELIANNVSAEEAKKISSQEARKKKQLLEAEFRRHIVEFARQFGITAASRRFKKKAATVKSWMGHFMKSERDAKRQEETELRKKQGVEMDSISCPKQLEKSSSPWRLSHVQKSPSSSRQRTPPESPGSVWNQDFVIKPTSDKSPLKLTFSPRRKSSPVIMIGSSTENDTVDDETNDIETDDEQEHAPGEYLEVAAWNLDNSGDRSESNNRTESLLFKESTLNVVDLIGGEDYIVKKSCNDHSSKTQSPPDDQGIPNKALKAGANKTSSTLDISQTDVSETNDSITSVDVQNIFDIENTNIVSEIDRLLESKIVKEKETGEGNVLDMKDLEEPLVIDDEEREAKMKEEGKIPYEETVMFKLLTDELDNFMKNDTVVVKYNLSKEPNVSKAEEKSPSAKDSSIDKPMKKFKKFADAEIMQNIEETYLFTGARVTRNTVGKELNTLDEEAGEYNGSEIETKENNEVSDFKQEIISNDIQAQEVKGDDFNQGKVPVSEDRNQGKTTELKVSDNQKKGDRSLFDFLSIKSDNLKGDTDKVVVGSSGASDEKRDEIKSPFNLFGNLMKSFQIEKSVSMKSPSKAEGKPENAEDNTKDSKKELEHIEKAEELVKDRTERNLFDFICPEVEMPKTPSKSPSPLVQSSPRMQTRSLFKSGKGIPLSAPKISPVKITPLKKPMFKFPKLALPVNFGNIAKLGMAKMKEEEKGKEDIENEKTKDICTYEKSEISHKDSGAKEHSHQVEIEKKETLGETKDEIVMETFEELRQRLSKERAANKKERVKEISDTELIDVDEIDGSRETSASVVAKTCEEINTEMYENFTPQKIVLILDISKKHGIEFASTSFGLPVSVIVNWIIEKDRKQRKVALSVSLEEKLKALKKMKDKEVTREAVKEKYNVDDAGIHKWDSEISWMIEDKSVCDILEKWETVETVSNINFEECSKNLERRDSLVEKELVNDQTKMSEQSEEKSKDIKESKELKLVTGNDGEFKEKLDFKRVQLSDNNIPVKSVQEDPETCLPQEKAFDRLETGETGMSLNTGNESSKKKLSEIEESAKELRINQVTDENDEIIITKVEKRSIEIAAEFSTPEKASNVTSNDDKDIPEVISFVRTSKPRDFTIEQKAMIVLLTEKYGNQLVSRKFGINTGTIYSWRHANKHVRQYLYEQGHSFMRKKDVCTDNSNVSDNNTLPNEKHSITASDFLPSRETRSSSDKKITETLNNVKTTKLMKESTASQLNLPQKSKVDGKELIKDKGLVQHPKGYRIISPTKLPPVLKDIKFVQAKDYTTEQKVAIVKLVQLYGVRTIHKQFHISTTSIWSWQNCKIVNEMLNEEEAEKNDSQGAQREINFDEDENAEEGPITIDTILDRVLIATDTSSHLNFDTHQRADIVCLINHFGIDYFCEKVPQIPRGTLWNWRHNKQVVALAMKKEEMIKKYADRLRKYEAHKMRENIVGETVDKTDLTQKWLKQVQDNIHGTKRMREESEERSKRKSDEKEISSDSNSRKKPKLGPMCYKRSVSNDRIRRSLSPSTICSETSVHSEDFEEILSDDELNTPSVISKKSGTSSQTVQSNRTSKSQLRTNNTSLKTEIGLGSQSIGTGIEKTDIAAEPVHEIVKFECGQDDRMLVCYKDLEKVDASVKYVKTDNASPALKRPSPMEASTLQPPSKKKPMNLKVSETSDLTGNWVPLDEYYYGTHEGDTSYTEEKGEYRFKCWYCSKMLYNNVRAMQHIQGHIDASKQQNIDLSDLTQCKHCYKQFDTPFEMQTHVEKVHLSNKVLMCRICEKDFSTPFQLTVHMKSNHQACEMPYVCHLCNFRSSMYSDVVDHFKKVFCCNSTHDINNNFDIQKTPKKHDSSHYMLCLYCLRTFEVKFVNQGWGQTQTYYGHLLKHQTKSATKKCVVCRLTFFNTQDVKNHRKNCHMGHFKDVKVFSPGGKADSGQKTRKGSNLKSLNAPSVSRIQDYGDIIFPAEASNTKCVECKMMMSSTDHYKKYVHCTMCRFATSCSIAYANHMMGFHSGQMSSLNLNIPWERPMKEVMYCACGFSSKYGNKIANHLVYCGKWTSYSTKRSYSKVSPGAAGEKKEEGSILGMLGLVQKSSVATIKDSDEIRSKPKLDSKPKEITSREVDEMEDDVNKKSVTIQLSDEKQGSEIQSGKTVSDDIKDNEKKEDIVTTKSNKFEEYLDKPKEISETKITSDTNEKVKDAEKDKTIKEQDIINLDSEDEASENTKSGETEPESIKLGNEAEMADKETEKEMATVTTETSFFSPTENERIKTKEKHEAMDQETVSEQDLKTETVVDVTYEKEEKMSASELRDTNEKFTTDGKQDSEIPSVEEIMDSESDLKEESPKVESENKEEMETFNKEKKQKEPETSIELHKVDEILEQEAEKQSSWTSSEEKSEDVDMDVDSVSMDTGDNVGDKVEILKDVTETIADIEDHTEENITEGKTKQWQQEQEVAEPSMDVEESSNAKEEKEHKDDDKPNVEKEHKEQEEDSKDGSISQKEFGNDVDKEKSTERASSNDQSSSSDRRSQDRHRDSSERHSTERRDSRDRHHSGSSERNKYDDRSRHDDRYRQENRSHGSDRSDSYHGKRSRNDQNRDRSYDRDRDRDRDCNRNRDQRHGDSRSGHGYQDNRGNGGQGHRSHQGHYGGYQGNRGDQYQDRNRGGNNQDRSYNRNYQNRGGYNQNYRGNYRGGYY